jgi:hypothetical protein
VLVHPELSLEPTGVPPTRTDADAQQAFIDILANDVIKPLEILKVSQDDLVLESLY